MSKPIERRLVALEQKRADEALCKGIRIFQQSHDTSAVFYELAGPFFAGPQGYTRADLSLLSAMGWQLIIAVYGETEAPNEY